MLKYSIPFVKMHGAGNDYILVDEKAIPRAMRLGDLAVRMSDRHMGIGSDGLIVVRGSARAAARMEMYNSDGSPSAMCGNGLRLVAKFVYDRNICKEPRFEIESDAGVHAVALLIENQRVTGASVEMTAPILDAARIPLDARDAVYNKYGFAEIPVSVPGAAGTGICLSMGNPHCVVFVENVAGLDIHKYGPDLERDARFPERANIEFTEIVTSALLRERTWERGAGETLSCGSGACAAAVAAIATGRAASPVHVAQTGGTLVVRWESGGKVNLSGPAVTVFEGEWPF